MLIGKNKINILHYLCAVRGLYLLIIILTLCGCQWGESPVETEDVLLIDEFEFDELVHRYENETRDIWQMPDSVIHKFGGLDGKTIADIGAGSGYFSFRLLEGGAKVVAIEIDDRFSNYLLERKSQLPDSLQTFFEVRLATPEDPFLQANEVDGILIANTFIYINNRLDYLKHLKQCLKKNGRILIIDYHKKPTKQGPPLEIRLPVQTISTEITEAGFTILEVDQLTLPYQYMILAEVR